MTTIDQVSKFLLGEAPLDGAWFGDKHPAKKGSFWWREHLRTALAAQPAGPAWHDAPEREAFDAFCKNTGRHPDDMKMAIWQAACAWQRERDAKLCEEWAATHAKPGDCTYEDCDFVAAAQDCADKIRSGS